MSEERALAKPESEAPAPLLNWEQVEAVRRLLAEGVAKADEAMQLIRTICGPQPAKGAQDMVISINQGTGYLRICESRIAAMFRELEKALLQQRCQHDRGLRHQGHDAFCKICGLEMLRNRVSGQYEPMWTAGRAKE
jgi:hypothetical protein